MSAALAMSSPLADPPAADVDPLDLLDEIVRTRRGELAGIARREGLGAEDAVDAVQDALSTFLHLALRGELPKAPAELAPFLGGVVRNAARNRRRLHHVARPHDALDAAPADVDGDPSELVARAEEHVRLRACVDRLCDTQRAVVTMRLLDERAGEDVAHALGITRGHVDVLVHRAKAQLRACMIDER